MTHLRTDPWRTGDPSPEKPRPPRARVIAEFARRFGMPPPFLARAPGRVNLIGDHTDYNEGFVLPLAIDRAVWIALHPRGDRRVVVHALDVGESAELDLDALRHARDGWVEYLRGVAWALISSGYPVRGWEGVVAGDVPVGAGLASSAALELATVRAFIGVAGLRWEPAAMARLAQRAENEWVGVQCGVMDQLIAAVGVAGHAVLIDCRSLETRPVPLPPGVAVVVLDTGTRRGLVATAYNERRAQCEAAATGFGVPALRDVPWDGFETRAISLDPVTRRRARHVVSENARVREAAEALARDDLRRLGRLLDESHASLRDDFEVSCAELDAMVAVARAHPACFGARMTGAGFGGCAVAVIATAQAQAFVQEVTAAYEARVGLTPSVYACAAAEGASLEGV